MWFLLFLKFLLKLKCDCTFKIKFEKQLFKLSIMYTILKKDNFYGIFLGGGLTSNMINVDKYADFMISDNKYTDSIFNTKKFK